MAWIVRSTGSFKMMANKTSHGLAQNMVVILIWHYTRNKQQCKSLQSKTNSYKYVS